MMDGYSMMSGLYGGMALFNLLAIGLVVLVYLWIYKIWKDINRKR